MKRMKKYITRLLTMVCLSAGFLLIQKTDAAAAADEFSMSISVTEYCDTANELLGYINAERVRVGVQPLVIDADLQEAAMQRSAEGAFVGGHKRPGSDWENFFTIDPTGKLRSENYCSGSGDRYGAYTIYNAWKTSEGHYKNMINPLWKAIGLGITDRCSYIVFGYGENLKQTTISGTHQKMRTVTGLRMSQCSFAGDGTYGGAYRYSLGVPEPLYILLSGKTAYVRGNDLTCFRFQSLTPDVATISEDGMLTAYKSGKMTLRATLKSNPSLNTISSFMIEVPQKEPEESEKPIKERNFLVKVKKGSYTYTGKAIKPKVKVYWWDENGNPVPWIYDYKVSYSKNKAVGTAKIKVQGTGIYKDLKGTATFTIKPRKVKISSVKSSKKKQLTVKWKKDSSVQGYEVQYSTSKKFKNDKIKKIAGKSKTGVTLKKLKSGKTYYVRMRSYKVSDGRKLYSAWSSKKKVRIR